jgi:hypothetical protein
MSAQDLHALRENAGQVWGGIIALFGNPAEIARCGFVSERRYR